MAGSLKSNIEKTIGKHISEDEFLEFHDILFEKYLDKKALLSEEGKTCKYIYFITEGSCYSYITDEAGEKHAVQFALENYWISDMYSFFRVVKRFIQLKPSNQPKSSFLIKRIFKKPLIPSP